MSAETNKILNRLQESAANAEVLRTYWKAVMPDAETPDLTQFLTWARIHHENLSAFVDAMDVTARKFAATSGQMDLDFLTRFASKVANTCREESRRAA